jgi:predicted nucleic acid-binding protein
LPQDKASAGIALALDLPDYLADDTELQVEAFALSCRTRHSVYDMMYLVLARRNDALFMTNDGTLRKLAAKHDVRVMKKQ